MTMMLHTERILGEVAAERRNQDEKWGPQSYPDGTGGIVREAESDMAREVCDKQHQAGHGTWISILREEVYEVFAETDPAKIREELIQVAAVAVCWIEDIDRKMREDNEQQ